MVAVESRPRRRPCPTGASALRCAAGIALLLCTSFSARASDSPAGLAGRPLEPHAAPRGPTMFVELPPENTGIRTENPYDDPRMWGDLYQEFEGGSIGTGVAIGDYDGDGRADVFVVGKTRTCRLFRNLGHCRFKDVTDAAGVADAGAAAIIWKNGATFADVNNDGRLDLYLCRFDAPNLLYLNQGDGTFKESGHALGLDVKDACVMAAFCDYDRDGRLDVYLATNMLDSARHPQGQRGHLLHQETDGTFQDGTTTAGISGESQSHSATWWDYDNDGWPDLYVANDYGVPDKLYHNHRDGTFTDVISDVMPHTSHFSMGADEGDVNNDGLIDLLVADMAATSHYKDQHSIAEARDKLTEPPNVATAPKYPHSALFLNTDTGHVLEAAWLAGVAATNWTWSVRFADLDNDGRLDLAVTNGFNRDPNPDVHDRSMKAESTAERIRILRDSPTLPETHFAFRNRGDLEFEEVGAAWGLDQTGVSFGAAFGDLSGDGNLDLVYSNYDEGVTFLRNDCDTGHRVVIDLRGTVSNRFGIGAVVRLESASGRQTRQLWLARGYMSSSEPAVHFGLGNDTVIRRLTVTWPSGLVQSFSDLPVDRRFTITEPEGTAAMPEAAPTTTSRPQFAEVSADPGLSVQVREEPVEETAAQRLLPFRFNRRGPALAVGDLNGDGIDDIAIGGTTVTPAQVLLGSPAGAFATLDTTAILPIGSVEDGPVLVFDADGDDRNDLLIVKGGNSLPADVPDYDPRLYLNAGPAGLQAAPAGTLPPLSISAGAAAAADIDRDGRLDVFIGGRLVPAEYPATPTSALLANRGGRFEDVTDSVAPALRNPGMVTAALWSDVDDDGWVDLLVALDWGPVRYFHNNQGRTFEEQTERAGFAAAGSGWWTSLAAADFNGDGRPDYVAGNVGLNTPYHADAAHPAVLFSGEFKGDGSVQLIEGEYDGDQLYPRRSRRTLAAVIPAILRRFPKNEDYAHATLKQVVGAEKLAAADRLAATELRSGVFLSAPGGTFHFVPLPRLAQIAPLQGMVAGDFDGDGHADLYAVQNSYAPIPATGRFNGGLSQMLRGDGHGNFSPAPPATNGLVVLHDAKALATLDLDPDGWPDFIVSRNNDTTLAFGNRGVEGRRSFGVRLRGLRGNRDAVGARITVELTDGSTEVSEVYAGSGYFSQSSGACFFGFPENNPPKRIRVRWPSGRSTEQALGQISPTLTLSAPPS